MTGPWRPHIPATALTLAQLGKIADPVIVTVDCRHHTYTRGKKAGQSEWQWLQANIRRVPMETSRLVATWRSDAKTAAEKAWAGPPAKMQLTIRCYVHGVGFGRKSDAPNWAPTAKACVDGLVDAGVLVDDNNDRAIVDMRRGDPKRAPQLEMHIRPTVREDY